MAEISLLVTSLLFGGTVLYAFGFATFVFTALPADTAGPLIRRAFPHFYLFVLGTSTAAAVLAAYFDAQAALCLVVIAASTAYARQILMPAINAATDAGAKQKFKRLHGLSVVITLLHIVIAAYVILRLARM
ncbi:MAG: DUF4149 domain-containing protein [Pseudomonadota bacterium]